MKRLMDWVTKGYMVGVFFVSLILANYYAFNREILNTFLFSTLASISFIFWAAIFYWQIKEVQRPYKIRQDVFSEGTRGVVMIDVLTGDIKQFTGKDVGALLSSKPIYTMDN